MGIIGVVAEADWPQDALSSDDKLIDNVKFQSLDDVILKDGAEYVPIYGRPDYLQQLREIADWMGNWVGDLGDEVQEHLVKQLQDSGHANVTSYCGPKQVGCTVVPDLVQVLEHALAESCALIAEVKTTLSDKAYIELECLLDTIRDMMEEGAPSAAPFKGKRLLGALAGRIITSNNQSSRSLLNHAERCSFSILLPNSKGFSNGDGCGTAPSTPSCFAATSSMPSRNAHASLIGRTRAGTIKSSPSRGRSFVKAPQGYIISKHVLSLPFHECGFVKVAAGLRLQLSMASWCTQARSLVRSGMSMSHVEPQTAEESDFEIT
ncbi:hypothetical protein WJX74_000934 [Apatococcus lobatus]|uniref:Uncharacterized protein n=1 Tax=Apatococcus lobatus TaxID=904363 RepID=A0AAW1QLA4_9CHLO